MDVRSGLGRAYRLLIRAVEAILIALIVALSVVVPVGVFYRYVLNAALSWTDEIGGTLLVWITFLGAVVALDRGTHLDMDLFAARVSPRVRAILRAITDLALAVLLAVVLVNGWAITSRLMGQTMVSTPLPRGLIQSVMPLSAALMLLVLAARHVIPESTEWGRRRAAPPDATE